ncbi:hypothetical protein MKEN_01356200 [Mycena kentingensis (nom. inval.)]|nr:hypothetical protein MKEN_01356200 [Mycena kentingensis (nom. inval.)]
MACECCSGLLLPQYGFGSEFEFRRLVERNPFLFRVHSPKSDAAPLEDAFVAPAFDPRYTEARLEMLSEPPAATYAEVAKHLDWTTRHSSVYVSTSFSFMWAIWEALRRYHFGVKHDIEIAIVDATAAVVSRRSLSVVEVMRPVPPALRHPDHWKWFHHAQESQSVLVYGSIPQLAVLASIPLVKILDALPDYCLRPFPSPSPTISSPVARVAWFYPRPPSKPNFHNFCTVQSALFRALSSESRNVDATHGAVKLAMAFLGGWAAWMVKLLAVSEEGVGGMENAEARNVFSTAAFSKVLELAQAIARWPGMVGEERPEQAHKIWASIVLQLANLVSEEIRAMETTAEVKRVVLPQVASPLVAPAPISIDRVFTGATDSPQPTPRLRPVNFPSEDSGFPIDFPELPPTLAGCGAFALPSPITRAHSHLPTPPPTPPPSLESPSRSLLCAPPITEHAHQQIDSGLITPRPRSRAPSDAEMSEVDRALEQLLTPPLSPLVERRRSLSLGMMMMPVVVQLEEKVLEMPPPPMLERRTSRDMSVQTDDEQEEVQEVVECDAEVRVEGKADVDQATPDPPALTTYHALDLPTKQHKLTSDDFPSSTPPDTELEGDDRAIQVIPAPPGFDTSPSYPPYALSDTASCLITGFLFGALIVVALSMRRPPQLLYCS